MTEPPCRLPHEGPNEESATTRSGRLVLPTNRAVRTSWPSGPGPSLESRNRCLSSGPSRMRRGGHGGAGTSRQSRRRGRRNVSRCAEPVAVVVEQMRIRLTVQCGSQAMRSADASAVQPSRSPVLAGGRSSVCTPARPVWLCGEFRSCQGNVLIGRRRVLPIVRGTNGGIAVSPIVPTRQWDGRPNRSNGRCLSEMVVFP
jgi:hypothetical protein